MPPTKRRPRFGSRETAVIGGLRDALAHVETALKLSSLADAHLSLKAASKRVQEAAAALDELITFSESTSGRPSSPSVASRDAAE
jgi:hypothetical protein